MQRYLFLIVINLLALLSIHAQNNDPDKLFWSSTRKIELADFAIQTTDEQSGNSSAVFEIEYGVKGFNFLRKNFNQKISHYMLRPSSQIRLDENVDQYLSFQQTMFDLEELYIRHLRKAVSENRHKLLFTTKIVDDLREQIIDNDLKERQALYIKETNSAENNEMQQKWESIINEEMKILDEYAYDY